MITRDAKRQRSHSSQRPFSDAYSSGLPAKRHKVSSIFHRFRCVIEDFVESYNQERLNYISNFPFV